MLNPWQSSRCMTFHLPDWSSDRLVSAEPICPPSPPNLSDSIKFTTSPSLHVMFCLRKCRKNCRQNHLQTPPQVYWSFFASEEAKKEALVKPWSMGVRNTNHCNIPLSHTYCVCNVARVHAIYIYILHICCGVINWSKFGCFFNSY